ncbi:hypothetical protein vseg_005035 [Gypsophila vaccaria]
MAGHTTNKNQQMPKLTSLNEANGLLMGFIQTRKPGNDLIQNCDLPPPTKVLQKSENKTVISDVTRKSIMSLTNVKQEENVVEDYQMGLMKALRLSQTRAREAEANCATIEKEFESLMVVFMEDSMRAFGYKCVVRMLEFQVLQMQQRQQQTLCHCCDCDSVDWMTALALCLGVAGFGFGFGVAIGFKYYNFFTFN